ncbi:MAG: response regulator transcription factor [Acidimicrobiales bacterium]
MPGFLIIMTLLTDVLLVVIAVQSLRLMQRIRTRFASLQASIVVLLCLAGVLSSIQDIGFQAKQLGWVSESIGNKFVGVIQAFLIVGGLLILVPVLALLRKLTVEFARAERLNDTLIERLPAGVTIESARLTPREVEVVASVGAGRISDSEIADALIISPSTAATHIRNIMRKTGIKRRADMALLALELEDDFPPSA